MVTDKSVESRGYSNISKLRKLSNFRKIIVRSTYYRLHVEPLWIFALFGVLLFRHSSNNKRETSTVRSSSNAKQNTTKTKTNTSNNNSNSITRKNHTEEEIQQQVNITNKDTIKTSTLGQKPRHLPTEDQTQQRE